MGFQLPHAPTTDGAGRNVAREIIFGPFRLLPERQLLLKGQGPVRIGSRALEILLALVERPGELLTKGELMARAWPDVVVDEGNLRTQVALLRRALNDGEDGSRYIIAVQGRGYRFVAPVEGSAPQVIVPVPTLAPKRPGQQLLRPGSRVIGRERVVADVAKRLQRHRLLTIVGPGGIGKTTVAIAVADEATPAHGDGTFFIDLAAISNSITLSSVVAGTLGLAVNSDDPIEELVEFLTDRRVLIVLDSCEHVLEAAGALAHALLEGTTSLRVLATSRELLRVEGETVHQLEPLAVPPDTSALTVRHALTFPAIELFVERASSQAHAFEVTEETISVISSVCRKLDGMALAIELAAGQVRSMGLRELASQLDDRFQLLMQESDMAPPRHRTLAAALDWSYNFLDPTEKVVLCRLSIFVGGFTLEAAQTIAIGEADDQADVIRAIADLVAKSLVSVNAKGYRPLYRLLDTTRAYASEKLVASGEYASTARRHATHCCAVLSRAGAEAEIMGREDWLQVYGHQIDNLRKALDWCFSTAGDAMLGVALTEASLPLWMHLSLMNECRSRVAQSLSALTSREKRDPRLELRFQHALGAVLLNIEASGPVLETALSEALRIAEHLDDTDYKMRVLWCLWCHAHNRGAFREALALADRFCDVAVDSPDPVDPLTGERMRGFTVHFLGDQRVARQKIEYMLDRYTAPVHRAHIIRFQFDQKITARNFLVSILWLQGFVAQALAMNTTNVEEAEALDHTLTLCNSLTKGACLLTLIANDLPGAQQYVDLLLKRSARDGLPIWHAWGKCFQGILMIKQGDLTTGLDLLRATLAVLPENRFSLRHTWVYAEYAAGLGLAGQAEEGLRLIDKSLRMCEGDEELWCIAEVLRIKGELLLALNDEAAHLEAEACFRQSLDWARRQEALSWELRTALSLALRQQRLGRRREALNLLAPIYGRFIEGFETADLRRAKALIRELSASE